jgi:isoleucyl-tRNA synthetase
MAQAVGPASRVAAALVSLCTRGSRALHLTTGELPGWATAEDNGISVAFDVELDDDLRREGRVFDLIHSVNAMRRAAGIELTDRIVLTLPEIEADLLAHRDWIAREVLAGEIDLRAGLEEPAIVKAEPANTPPSRSGPGSQR